MTARCCSSTMFGVLFLLVALVFAAREDAGQQHRQRLEPVARDSPVRVEVLFVRHGHACHNALKYHSVSEKTMFTTIGNFNHCKYPDPPLTDCGLKQSQANGISLRKALEQLSWSPLGIFSSSMIRAMETAMSMFPGQRVWPLPFISETYSAAEKAAGFAKCNMPKSLGEQQAYMQGKPIDWQHVSNDFNLTDDRIQRHVFASGYSGNWNKDQAREEVHYREFRAFLGEQVVPRLLPSAVVDEHGTRSVKVVIVSHSKFLKEKLSKYFDCKTYFVNNGAMLFYYDYDQSRKMLAEGASPTGHSCVDIQGLRPDHVWYDQKHPEQSHDYACPVDYARCLAVNPAAMGVADGHPGDRSPWIKANVTGQECCVQES